MENSKSKIFAQFIAGIFGGTILGITVFLSMTFLTMIYYGGNYGCWAFIDSFLGTTGYESCVLVGSIAGLIIGVIIAIAILSKVKIINYSKVAIYLLLGSFILPLLYGVIIGLPNVYIVGLPTVYIALPVVIFVFMGVSIIPSIIITGAINLIKFLRRK